MTAMTKYQEIVTPSRKGPLGADQWMLHCGSFDAYGLFGELDDHVTEMYLKCTVDNVAPNRIVMSPDVMASHIRKETRWHFNLLAQSSERMIANLGTETADKHLRAVQTVASWIERGTGKIFDAQVSCSRDLAPGTILFYRDAELLGETHGWTN